MKNVWIPILGTWMTVPDTMTHVKVVVESTPHYSVWIENGSTPDSSIDLKEVSLKIELHDGGFWIASRTTDG